MCNCASFKVKFLFRHVFFSCTFHTILIYGSIWIVWLSTSFFCPLWDAVLEPEILNKKHREVTQQKNLLVSEFFEYLLFTVFIFSHCNLLIWRAYGVYVEDVKGKQFYEKYNIRSPRFSCYSKLNLKKKCIYAQTYYQPHLFFLKIVYAHNCYQGHFDFFLNLAFINLQCLNFVRHLP